MVHESEKAQILTPVADALRIQAEWCRKLGSPLNARLLDWAVGDFETQGPIADLLGAWSGHPVKDAMALRWTGAMHALVLLGRTPQLAAHYPGGEIANATDLGASLSEINREHAPFIREFLRSPPQTNEVGRSAVLIGGFLEIARRSGLPLRPLEIGASAGLNTSWDGFSYRLGEASWGDPASPVRLAPAWSGPAPDVAAKLVVARRAACDLEPFDIEDETARLRLRAYIWPDMTARLAAFDGALAIARRRGVRVEKADAAEWLERQLRDGAPGEASVLYHTIMWQYMPTATQARIERALAEAGARASRVAPLFWLRFEPVIKDAPPELRLTAWPGGETATLATAHYHGTSVAWRDRP